MRKSLVALLFLLFPGTLFAAREIGWNALEVKAHLESDGRLHVMERHRMLFTGDWNGGERVFRLEPSQELSVESVTRIDAAGTPHELALGGLSEVDHWELNGLTLRWRARAPSDPEFDNTPLTYEIRYTLANILVPAGGNRYDLRHDFAFPNRPSPVRDFDLELTFAPEWNHQPIRTHKQDIPRGKSYVVITTLRYTGTAAPSAAPWYSPWISRLRPWLVVVPTSLLLALFFFREARSRRSIIVDDRPIDRAWLNETLFAYAPEVAGAMYDGEVGPPEVAALLATMERDGKVSTSVSGKGKKANLTVKLLVPKKQLESRERDLADLLFTGDTTEVRANDLRNSRKQTGFDPAGAIRSSIAAETQRIAPGSVHVHPVREITLLIVTGLALLIVGIVKRQVEFVFLFAVVFGAVGTFASGFTGAARWKKGELRIAALMLVVPAVVMVLVADLLRRFFVPSNDPVGQMTTWSLAGLGILLFAAYRTILSSASDGVTPRAAAVRAQLTRARAWFQKELGKPVPEIDNAWVPWLIALGLDGNIASWWKEHGAARQGSGTSNSTSSRDDAFGTSSTSSSFSSGERTSAFSAGEGRFGGAGSTGSWGAAATAFAAPISAPRPTSSSSSSSSSSSDSSWSSSDSSSDSSSGGGGGGGW
jgi:uncharacterized membrane protein YgcG